jgi:hypothetical protein
LNLPQKGDLVMNIRWILLVSLFSLVLASCSSSPQAAVEKSPNIVPLNPQEVSTGTPENPIQLARTPEITDMNSNPPAVDKFVQIAKRDLADRLKIGVDQITLIEATEFTWPNAALGCPSPGMVYASVRVPGYRVRLGVNGVEYNYNMDQTGKFVLCPELNLDDNVSQNPTVPDQPQSVTPGVPIK